MATAVHPRHITSAAQFDRDLVDRLLDRSLELEGVRDSALAGKIMAALFFEPSTRTRLSFESAMVRRGGSVIGTEAAFESSSAAKGETLEDTIRIVAMYGDVIVVRHPASGAAQIAASVSPVPVINAGDGGGEHPTQALIDLLTIRKELGEIDGKRLVLCGDLAHARTAHSLALMASNYDIEITCVAPRRHQMPVEIVEAVRARGVQIHFGETLDGLDRCDVLYQTRLQRERFGPGEDAGATEGFVVVDTALMSRLPAHAIVMQPLPRTGDVLPEVDADPRAAYFRQAANGVPLRMALLDMVLNGPVA